MNDPVNSLKCTDVLSRRCFICMMTGWGAIAAVAGTGAAAAAVGGGITAAVTAND